MALGLLVLAWMVHDCNQTLFQLELAFGLTASFTMWLFYYSYFGCLGNKNTQVNELDYQTSVSIYCPLTTYAKCYINRYSYWNDRRNFWKILSYQTLAPSQRNLK